MLVFTEDGQYIKCYLFPTDISQLGETSKSVIEACLCLNKHAIITNLFTQPNSRGKGYGTLLLRKIIFQCTLKDYIKYITVDDMSDNYRSEHNIYLKHGFRYIADTGPEMILNLR